MEEKREIEITNHMSVVTLNQFITARGLESLSLQARKLLYLTIAQSKMQDNQFYFFELTVTDFAKIMGISPQALKKRTKRNTRVIHMPTSDSEEKRAIDWVTDELMGLFLNVQESDTKWKKYHVFTTCAMDKNNIRLEIDPNMSTLLLNLKKGFSQPKLLSFLKMKSPYSMAVWHLMQREMQSKTPGVCNSIYFYLSVQELRRVTVGDTDKYKQIVEFRKNILDLAIKEIWICCYTHITYENIKQGRKVIGFNFTATSIHHVNPDKISQAAKDKVRRFEEKMSQKEQNTPYSYG